MMINKNQQVVVDGKICYEICRTYSKVCYEIRSESQSRICSMMSAVSGEW